MFLRAKTRIKDGKAHRYWSIVENRRTRGNRVVQRQVLYLGEVNDSPVRLGNGAPVGLPVCCESSCSWMGFGLRSFL
ncbi:MAG: hypothetical protein USCGTAYLOR_02689 [Chromatiales bacterium USCg_Taylor]|nr:MAG: hypothetical protein USCGTAYLOR_02689 [Chromatiales bacterium USCg_Taylor]